MKKYAIIDQIKNGDQFEETFDTEAEAVNRSGSEWDRMSEHDKKRREWYAVVECELNEDGCADLNTATIIKVYK